MHTHHNNITLQHITTTYPRMYPTPCPCLVITYDMGYVRMWLYGVMGVNKYPQMGTPDPYIRHLAYMC